MTNVSTPIDWTSVDVAVFDLDGTLYLGEAPLPGAHEFLAQVPKSVQMRFLSNNTSKTPEETWQKLIRLGFQVELSQIISPLHGLISAINENQFTQIWLMANPAVLAWVQNQLPHVQLKSTRNDTQAVCVAYDDQLNYTDLCEVAWRLQDGKTYWVTHPDYVCPNPQGSVPDVGGLIELWAIGTGRRPDRCFGKPFPDVLAPITANTPSERILFVGDRLYTDWELSKRAKTQFRLSLAGETTLMDWQALKEKPLLL